MLSHYVLFIIFFFIPRCHLDGVHHRNKSCDGLVFGVVISTTPTGTHTPIPYPLKQSIRRAKKRRITEDNNSSQKRGKKDET